MGKVARPRIVTKDAFDSEGLPDHVQVALAEVASAAREGVLALSVACGLQVVHEIMAADVTRICGPRGKHDQGREAYRHGTEPRLVPLGGALVGIERPRMRSTDGKEVPLSSYEVFADRDLLGELALGCRRRTYDSEMGTGLRHGEARAPDPRPTGSSARPFVLAWVRSVLVGAVVLGLGSRAVMRIVGALATPEHAGEMTVAGNVVGRVTVGGSLGHLLPAQKPR